MALNKTHLTIAFIVVAIAVFMLFYIFDNINKLAERCKAGEELSACTLMTGFNMSMLIILLIVGGFILIVSVTLFILMT
jgi:hypothetical protein